MLRRNGPVVKSVESVLRLEGSLWGERFVEEVGLELGVKERGRIAVSWHRKLRSGEYCWSIALLMATRTYGL